MSWKDFPYWLKNGIKVSVIFTFIVVLGNICFFVIGESPFICIPLVLPGIVFTSIARIFGFEFEAPINWPAVIIGTAILWFIIGVLYTLIFKNKFKKK